MRSLSRALIEHERIITTVEKAKELRGFIEPLITLAKDGSLHARRQALSRLPDRTSVKKLFDVLGPRFADRPGGYTRVIKRHERRLGDAGRTAIMELLKEGETKVQRRAPAAPVAPAPARQESVEAPEPAATPETTSETNS
jgi:large subunit ribosomal protein L17